MGQRGERRWGEQAPGTESEARERLLSAAEDCFTRFGVAKTTVTDVAQAAKVTRPTVYRYFDGRDALVRGVLMRDAERFRKTLEQQLTTARPLPVAVLEALLSCLERLPAEPRFLYLFAPERGPAPDPEPEDLVAIGHALLAPIFDRIAAEGRARSDVPHEQLLEWTMRGLLSLIRIQPPAHALREETRAMLEHLLVPVLLR